MIDYKRHVRFPEHEIPPKCSLSGVQSKKPRVVRGLRLPQGLLSRFEIFVLAETQGFEPWIQVLPRCTLRRGVPSTPRPRLQN